GAHEDLTLGPVIAVDAPDNDEVACAVDRKYREERVRRTRRCVGDLDELAEILSTSDRVEEMQRACRVGSSDVEVQTLRTAQACGAPGRLEDPAGHLVDRGVSVRAEGRVHGTQRHRGALVGGTVHEAQAVGRPVAWGPAVRAGSYCVAVFGIYE